MVTNLAIVMATRTSIFVFALFLGSALATYHFTATEKKIEKGEYPQNVTNFKTLKEFVKLVEENNLNVSLIVSSGKNYEEGGLKEALALTITFPVNEDSVTKATLTKEAVDQLVSVANEEKITAGGSLGKNDELRVLSNNIQGIPINRAYKIFTGIKNGKTGFVFDEENYVAQYTFITPGSDGKNATTKVLYGDVDVEVVSKSPELKDDDLAIIKKALIDAFFTFDDSFVSKGITSILASTLPSHTWDAAGGVGEDNYIESDYWVLLKILTENYIVYAS